MLQQLYCGDVVQSETFRFLLIDIYVTLGTTEFVTVSKRIEHASYFCYPQHALRGEVCDSHSR